MEKPEDKKKQTEKADAEANAILNNILSLAEQLKQMSGGGNEGDIDEVLEGVDGMTDEMKASIKAKYQEKMKKMNAESSSGAETDEGEQPGAKKAEDNTGAGSTGSDSADDRAEDDNTKITQEAVDELSKNMLQLTNILKSIQNEHKATTKAVEFLMDYNGVEKAMKELPAEQKPQGNDPLAVFKDLTKEIAALKGQGGQGPNPAPNTSREKVRKSLRDNLGALLGRTQ